LRKAALRPPAQSAFFPITDGAIKPLVREAIPLTGASIVVPAGHHAVVAFVAVGAGADFPACTIGLTPA
jgi:hypothetical protein